MTSTFSQCGQISNENSFDFSNFLQISKSQGFFPIWIIIVLIFLDARNLQEQDKKAFCYQKLFWPFTVWKNCSSDLKNFANSQPSATNFKTFPRSLEQFFLTVGQNNFGNKIPFPHIWWIFSWGKIIFFAPSMIKGSQEKKSKCVENRHNKFEIARKIKKKNSDIMTTPTSWLV